MTLRELAELMPPSRPRNDDPMWIALILPIGLFALFAIMAYSERHP